MRTGETDKGRLVVVSNRLPVILKKDPAGKWHTQPGSGGLVTALSPVLKNSGGLWIGWSGVTESDEVPETVLHDAAQTAGYTLFPVHLCKSDVAGYYHGFANEILWPLFHDLQTRCRFDPDYWRVYRKVNRQFADAIAAATGEHDRIWIHDYHLMEVGRELREHRPGLKIAYFLHIPFPSPDLFVKLPWRFEILDGLLHYDLIGFQTRRDKRNFIQCLRFLRSDISVRGKGQVTRATVNDRQVRIGTFPISIDVDEFADKARSTDVERRMAEIRSDLGIQPDMRNLILGVDRLDYSKGIPERLNAFATALERYPHLRERISLVQIVVPSRVHIPKYKDLKLDIERLVSKINGRYTQTGWVPIHYIFRSVDRAELVALYRAADIALITPLKGGMNLVAKEYCAANVSEDGVLILSEFAGAAEQLQKAALLVNPYHYEEVAGAIALACDMPANEKRRRMRTLRKKVRGSDIYWWVSAFMNAVFKRGQPSLYAFDDYRPVSDMKDAREHPNAGRHAWIPIIENPGP